MMHRVKEDWISWWFAGTVERRSNHQQLALGLGKSKELTINVA